MRMPPIVSRAGLLAPAGLVFLVLFVLPCATMVLYSFYGYSRLAGIVRVLGFGNYDRLLTDAYYLSVLGRTLQLGLITALVTLVAGYPIALFVTSTGPRLRLAVILAVLSPLLVSVVVRSFGWIVILGPRGLLDEALIAVGLPAADLLNSQTAVVIALVNVLLPYMVLSIATALQSVNPA